MSKMLRSYLPGVAVACGLLCVVPSFWNCGASVAVEDKSAACASDGEAEPYDGEAKVGIMSLIQSEMLMKSRSQGSKNPSAVLAQDTDHMPGGISSALNCEAKFFAGTSEPEPVQALPEGFGQLGGQAVEEDMTSHMRPPGDSSTNSPSKKPEALTAALRYLLQVLIIWIIADGVSRWRAMKAASGSAAAEVTAEKQSQACPELVRAALKGDVARFEAALDTASNVDGADLWGCTALHAAAAQSGPEGEQIANLVLQRGAQVNVRDSCDESPLHFAARKGTTEVCEVLLAYGAHIDAANIMDKTPLVLAAQEGREDMVNFLLGRGATIGNLPQEDLELLPFFFRDMMAYQVAASACVVGLGDDAEGEFGRDDTCSGYQ